MIDKTIITSEHQTAAGERYQLIQQLMIYGSFCLLALAATVTLGPWLLHLIYDDKFADYHLVLLGWCLIFSLLGLTLPLETMVARHNRMVAYNHGRLISGAVGAGLAVYLCPDLGVNGAVIASISGWAVAILYTLWLLRDKIWGKV
jgi:O-antigen/teichoic acid export membrane protein